MNESLWCDYCVVNEVFIIVFAIFNIIICLCLLTNGSKVSNFALTIPRGGAVVARWAHNPKVVSSSLAPATKQAGLSKMAILLLFLLHDTAGRQ